MQDNDLVDSGQDVTFFRALLTRSAVAALIGLLMVLGVGQVQANEMIESVQGTSQLEGLDQRVIDFGGVNVGSNATATLTITNSGTAPLTWTGLDTGASVVSSSAVSGAVASGASMTITLTFTPTVATTYSGVLTVTGNQTSGTNTITWTGTGTTPEPAATRIIGLSGTTNFVTTTPDGIYGPPPPVAPAVVRRDSQGRVTVRAVRLEESLRVDGQLDESIYANVATVSNFLQQEPREGEPSTEKTEFWVFFDDDTFYLSVRVWDSDMANVVTRELRRGNSGVSQDDSITLTLDTFYDRRNGYYFQTNSRGTIYDALIADERSENLDWDTVFVTKSARFDWGWTMEFAIPFKSLRYPGSGEQIWGINVRRTMPRQNELAYLSPPPASYGRVGIWKFSSSATLVGVEAPRRSINLEFKPYGIADFKSDTTVSPAIDNEFTRTGGFDLKYGLTRGIVADFTYKTDFAQVEVDDAMINLTRFGMYFPEKRQFFLEGQDLFSFGGAGPRFSGTPPGDTPVLFFSRRIGLSDGTPVPIIGGGRVAGRAGPYSIGLLNIHTEASPTMGVGKTAFSVVRLKRNIFQRSSIGVIGTQRSLNKQGTGSNEVYGVDGRLALLSNFFVDAYYARSDTVGRTGNNASYRLRIENNGDRYGFHVEHLLVGKDFNPEVGFLRRDDFRRNLGQLRFSPRPEMGSAVRKYTYEVNFDQFASDSTGVIESQVINGRFRTEFQSADRIDLDYVNQYEYLTKPFKISDGVEIPVGGYYFENVRASILFARHRRFNGTLKIQAGDFFGGTRTEVSYKGRAQLTTGFVIEPSVAVNWIDLPQGKFSTEIGQMRLIYSMTPRMFVEALTQYTSRDKSVSSNVRYRWEYQPGSDIYIVYSEGRDSRMRGFSGLLNRGVAIKFTKLLRF